MPRGRWTPMATLKWWLTANPLTVVTFLYTPSQACSAFGISHCQFDYICLNVNSRRVSSASLCSRQLLWVSLLQHFEIGLFSFCFFLFVFLRCGWFKVTPQSTNFSVFTACLFPMAALNVYLLVNQSTNRFPFHKKSIAYRDWQTHVEKAKQESSVGTSLETVPLTVSYKIDPIGYRCEVFLLLLLLRSLRSNSAATYVM